MKILVDTNVIMDYLADRKPFSEDAFSVLGLCIEKHVEAAIAAHTIVDLFYLLRKDIPANERRTALRRICTIFVVVGIDAYKIESALESDDFTDFEDCLQMECAKEFGADYIVTRNTRDFKNSSISAIEPKAFLALI